MIHVHQLPHLDNKDLKLTQAKPRQIPEGMPRLHFLMGIIGSRGAGKTTALINMIKMYDHTKSFDKIYFFSPTFHNDPKYKLLETDKHNYKLEVFGNYSDDVFKDVLQEIRDDIDEYKQYERKLKLYQKFMKVKSIDSLTPEELLDLELDDFEEPTTEFKHGMPTSLIVLDDLVGNTDLYKANAKGVFNNFVILHRHLLTSVIFLCQVYQNGIPRQIRNNLSCLLLFRNKNDAMKKQIAEEASSFVTVDHFLQMWDYSCVEPWDFFMIDFDTKDKQYRFRKNFNELVELK